MSVSANGVFGEFGKLHPVVCENFELPSDVYVAQIDLTEALENKRTVKTYSAISKLHPIDRDLAVIVERDTAVGDMLASVKSASAYISDVKLFDIYEGDQIENGYKSVAFSMRIQPTDKSFSDAEIKSIMDEVLAVLQNGYGARLR